MIFIVRQSSASHLYREWVAGLATNPIVSNQFTNRYSQTFGAADYRDLILIDPSYDIQKQWFISASFGLFQQMPESVRTALGRSAISSTLRTNLLSIYDPSNDSSATLFSPSISVEFAAFLMGNATLTAELSGPLALEDRCVIVHNRPNQCTWKRFWRRALRAYNRGIEEDESWLTYDEEVFSNVPIFVSVKDP
jgi:hypothetical protein